MQLRDKIILQKIINAIEVGLKVFNNISLENFLNDDEMKLAMSMTVIRIGELVKTLTDEFRKQNSQVAWRDISGFRDIVAHKYDVINMSQLYGTVTKDFPELKLQIEKILAEDK